MGGTQKDYQLHTQTYYILGGVGMPSTCHLLPKDGIKCFLDPVASFVVKESAPTHQKYGTLQPRNTLFDLVGKISQQA